MAIQNPGTYGIITKGLGLPACEGMIVNHFQLGRCKVDIYEPGTASGGSTPMAPGEFYDNFRVSKTDPTNNYHIKQKEHITIRIRMDDDKFKKSFIVNKRTGYVVVKALTVTSKFVDSTVGLANTKFGKVIVKSLKTGSNKLSVTISKLKMHK
jgi:hypothetical protein